MSRPAPSPGQVFLAFLALGLTSFGGPVAHIGYFRKAFVARRGWLDEREYAELAPRRRRAGPYPLPGVSLDGGDRGAAGALVGRLRGGQGPARAVDGVVRMYGAAPDKTDSPSVVAANTVPSAPTRR